MVCDPSSAHSSVGVPMLALRRAEGARGRGPEPEAEPKGGADARASPSWAQRSDADPRAAQGQGGPAHSDDVCEPRRTASGRFRALLRDGRARLTTMLSLEPSSTSQGDTARGMNKLAHGGDMLSGLVKLPREQTPKGTPTRRRRPPPEPEPNHARTRARSCFEPDPEPGARQQHPPPRDSRAMR